MRNSLSIKIFISLFTVLLASGLSTRAAAQDVIRASGGTNLSIDDVGGAFSTLSGPTIRETATNQLELNQTIVLTLPDGYEWNTALTVMPQAKQGDVGTEDITFTIESVGAQNTDLRIEFTSLTTSEFTFTITQTSNTAGAGKGPARLSISGLQLRPTDTIVPDEATITNTGTTGPLDANYGNLSKKPGSIAEIRVETAADGSGTVVSEQDLLAGNSITVYSIARDIGENFINNVSLNDEADWNLIEMTGGITQPDLTPQAGLNSAVFSSQSTGSAKIEAVYQDATPVPGETITVVPRTARDLQIRTQPSAVATAGETFPTQPVIELLDQFGNLVTSNSSTQVTVSINSGDGDLTGTLTQTANQGLVTFTDLLSETADNITLQFANPDFDPVVSNEITIQANTPVDLAFLQQPTNTSQNGTIDPPVEVQLLDIYGNAVPQSGIEVTVNAEDYFANNAVLTATTDTDGIATFGSLRIKNTATVGEADLTVSFPGINAPVTSNTFQIISSSELNKFAITAPDGTDLGEQVAGETFNIRITALDGKGFVYDAFEGTVDVTSDSQIQVNGTPVDGFTTDNFVQGELETSIMLTASGAARIYAENTDVERSGRSNQFLIRPSVADFTNTVMTASPGEITADGESSSLITVQLRDEFENNLTTGGESITIETDAGLLSTESATDQLSVAADDNGDGSYTATLTSSETVETALLTSLEGTAEIASASVDFIPGNLASFIISIPEQNGEPAGQTAGVPFLISVEAVDAFGNRVESYNGTLNFSTASTISSGASASIANGYLEDHSIALTQSGTGITISTEDPEIFGVSGTSPSFTVTAAAPDPASSQVLVNPDVLQNDGMSQSTVTVILRDEFQNRILSDESAGLSISIHRLELDGTESFGTPDATITGLVFQSAASDYQATLTSDTTIELVEVRVSYSGTLLPQTPTVDIVVPNMWQPSGSGAQRVDWNRPDNWSLGRVPEAGDFVLIPGGASDYPDLDQNVTPEGPIGSLEIREGAQLVLFGGNQIDVSGEVLVDGSFDIEDNTSLVIGGNFTGTGSFSSGNSTQIEIQGDMTLANFLARTDGTIVRFNGSTDQIVTTPTLLAQKLEILNNVTVVSGELVDTAEIQITEGQTFELARDADITVDNLQNISGQGTMILNNNTLVVRGDLNLLNLDTSEGTVIFGIRLDEDFADYPDLQRQQIASLSQMKNAIINNTEGVRTFEDIIVDGDLTLQNGVLIISSGKNFIAPNTSYVNGTLQFRRNIQSPGWKMISSPVGSTFQDLFDGLTVQGITGSDYPDRQPNLMWYDETFVDPDNADLTTDNQRWRAPGDITNAFGTGMGYFFYVFGDVGGDGDYNDILPKTLDVTGRENFAGEPGDFTFPVTYTAEADTGWNMVGNPFGATLDWDEAGWTKENMDNVLYIWDSQSQEYKYWNGEAGNHGSGKIAPFQGFWVKANAVNPVLAVNPSNKTTGGVYRKGSERYQQVPVIALQLNSEFHTTSTHFTFTEKGSFTTDRQDAYRLLPFDSSTYLEIYSLFNDGTELIINNLPRDFGKTIEIPVEAGAVREGDYYRGIVTLTWPELENIPDGWTIELVDNHTGQKIDLKENSFYDFEIKSQGKAAPQVNSQANFSLLQKSAAKSRNSRFTLLIEPGTDGSELPTEVSLNQNYPNPFNPSTTIDFALPVEDRVRIDVFDILGRRVHTITDQRFQAGYHEVSFDGRSLASGVYFYRLITSEKVLNKRMTLIK